MPSIFKALSTISAWVLFVFGLVWLIIGFVLAFSSGLIEPEVETYFDFAVGVASIILSVIIMELRRRFE